MLELALLLLAAPVQDTAYFQQHVDYRIEARLDEAAQVLNGRLRLDYRNNSPERIDTLWFHLHLNAFQRVKRIEIGGRRITPVYPGAPDSTVMGVPLPEPIAPGATVTVEMDWDARPSTTPRRQGRRGRHFDFAQWYPRIAVFDRG